MSPHPANNAQGSPAQDDAERRTRARRAEALFAAAVAVAALALFAVAHAAGAAAPKDAPLVATITRNGAVVDVIDLSAVKEPYAIELKDASGANTVSVEPGRIRVAQADCPDKVCVNTGWIDAPGRPIACVPHGLTVVVEREGGGGSDLDATAR